LHINKILSSLSQYPLYLQNNLEGLPGYASYVDVGGTASSPLQAAGWAASATSLTGPSDLKTDSYGFKRIQLGSRGIDWIQRSKADLNEIRLIQTDLKRF
jgi:hypothetical protein